MTTSAPSDSPSSQAEAALAELTPRERQLVAETLDAYPQLSLAEALTMLRYFGGL